MAFFLIFDLSLGFFLYIFSEIWLPPKFKSEENSFPKNNIVVLSESISTISSPVEKNWPHLLNTKIQEFDSNWQVLNFSEPGVNSSYLVDKLSHVVDEVNPKIIVAMMGINEKVNFIHKNTLIKNSFLKKLNTIKIINFFYIWYGQNSVQKKLNQFSKKNDLEVSHLDDFKYDEKIKKLFLQNNLISFYHKEYLNLSDNEKGLFLIKSDLMNFDESRLSNSESNKLFFEFMKLQNDFILKYENLISIYLDYALKFKDLKVCKNIHNDLAQNRSILRPRNMISLLKCLGNESNETLYWVNELYPLIDKVDYYSVEEILHKNYLDLLKISREKNICLIIAEYPLMSIRHWKIFFKRHMKLDDRVFFVENKKNFESELKEKPYTELFIDRFAWRFGHLNDKGSEIVARQVYKKIKFLIAGDMCGVLSN